MVNATEKEIEFVKGLGKWSEKEFDRLKLLKKYRNALENRENMGGINKKEVLMFVNDLIRRLEQMGEARIIQKNKK